MSDALHAALEAVWRTPTGLRALTGVNHSTIGIRYLVTGGAFFVIGGLLAMLMRSQLALPANTVLGPESYNAAFTLHGTVMMFFFAVPIMEGLAVYLVPKMIGARDLIFPRLSAFGYWCYLFGGLLLLSSLVFGTPPDTGWFMYTPLSSKPYSSGPGADFWLIGVTFAEISALSAAVELVVSILKTRTPGMSLHRMPLYVWYILVTSLLILFAFPPLILGSILLEIERAFSLPFFDPARGGDPLLWQHLFWLFGHPEVYIIFLPAAAIVSTVVPTFARRPIAGYTWIVLAVIATAFLSYALWVHHMFTTGIPLLSLAFFSAASMAVAVPTAIQVFAWIATLWNGRPVVAAPLLHVLGFLFVFVLGGLTGVMVAHVAFDWQVHDTHFVVAHLHYVLIGGLLFPLFAGIYYWLPLITGRALDPPGSRLAFWLFFIGVNLTFLPMHWTGLLGMPRRVYTYESGLGWDLLNLLSTLGGFVMAAGVAAMLIDVLLAWRYSDRLSPNPWSAGTLEWAMRVPAPSYTFASQPIVSGRDPLWDDAELPARIADGHFYLGHPQPRWREMLITSARGASPQLVAILPGNTWLPLIAAACCLAFFACFLAGAYPLAGLGACGAIVALVCMAWRGLRYDGPAAIDSGRGLELPVHYAARSTPGVWGTATTLLADATLFASLLFAYAFLWMHSPAWPPSPGRGIDHVMPAIALALLLASSAAMAVHRHAWAILLGAGYVLLQVAALSGSTLEARLHAYDAVVFTIFGYTITHIAIGMLLAGFVLARRRSGARNPGEARVAALFWHYGVAASVVAYATVHFASLAPSA